MPMSIDDAIGLIVEELRSALPLSPQYSPNARTDTYGCDLRVANVVRKWWLREHGNQNPGSEPGEIDYEPFQDAAWELARRGILRPGRVLPGGVVVGSRPNTEADGFSLTATGRDWVAKYDQQGPLPVDPGRFAALVRLYSDRFGPAFSQRVNEAAGCFRTCNYFATCTMAGAACESILVAIAIEQTKDEDEVLKIYLGRNGRRSLIKQITAGKPSGLQRPVETAASLLSFWRDSAAHGYETQISEFEAHDALSRLLRLSQFVDQHWAELTQSPLERSTENRG
jgi:hypothetical protein